MSDEMKQEIWQPMPVDDPTLGLHLERLKQMASPEFCNVSLEDKAAIQGVLDAFFVELKRHDQMGTNAKRVLGGLANRTDKALSLFQRLTAFATVMDAINDSAPEFSADVKAWIEEGQ